MKLENGEISNTQLMILVLSFLQSMILTINFVYSISKFDTWIAVLTAYVIAIFFTLLYLKIGLKFPGKNLVEINDIVFGPYFGKLISASYIWFFFQYMIHYMYFFNSFCDNDVDYSLYEGYYFLLCNSTGHCPDT